MHVHVSALHSTSLLIPIKYLKLYLICIPSTHSQRSNRLYPITFNSIVVLSLILHCMWSPLPQYQWQLHDDLDSVATFRSQHAPYGYFSIPQLCATARPGTLLSAQRYDDQNSNNYDHIFKKCRLIIHNLAFNSSISCYRNKKPLRYHLH